VYPGGTHDFPVWFKGFHDFIQMVFKKWMGNKKSKTFNIKIKKSI
jgi:hypothetical protein